MRNLVILGAIGAGGYYAFKRGYLPQFAPIANAIEPILGRVANILPQSEWDAPLQAKAQKVADIKAASGGMILPILGRDEVVSVNPYEGMLRRNWGEVSNWARRNIGWAAAIAKVENAGMKPTISGDNGTSHGVYQVKVATAETCYRAGYTRHQPTKANLLTEAACVYFGTAEMERLSSVNGDLDWIVQAYNGGAGFQQMNAKYVADRGAYLNKVKRAFGALYGSVSA